MGRLRARLSRSDVDRELQGRLAAAEREVLAALAICDRAKKTAGVEAHRSRRTKRGILRVLGSLRDVGRLTPIREEMAEVPPTKSVLEVPPPPKPTLSVAPPVLPATPIRES